VSIHKSFNTFSTQQQLTENHAEKRCSILRRPLDLNLLKLEMIEEDRLCVIGLMMV
jgi:hypothetical protein